MSNDKIAALEAELEGVEKQMKAINETHKVAHGTRKDVREFPYFKDLDKRHREILAEIEAVRRGQAGQ